MATNSSHKTLYWIIGVIVIVAVVLFGGYKVWHHYTRGSALQYANTTSTSANNTVTRSPSQGNQVTGNSGLPNKTDTSNQQLDNDMQNIQNSMNQLQQDQGTANQDSGSQSKDIPQQ